MTRAVRRLVGAVTWLFGLVIGTILAGRSAVRTGRFLLSWDEPVTLALARSRSAALVRIFRALAYLASPIGLILTLLVVVAVLCARDRRFGPIWFGALALLAGPLESSIKAAVHRARPPLFLQVPGVDAAGSSFPSGHATQSAAVYGAIAVLCWRRTARTGVRVLLVAATVALIGTVAFSRVYLGVHWLSDVLVGLALGSSWLLVVLAIEAVARQAVNRREAR